MGYARKPAAYRAAPGIIRLKTTEIRKTKITLSGLYYAF